MSHTETKGYVDHKRFRNTDLLDNIFITETVRLFLYSVKHHTTKMFGVLKVIKLSGTVQVDHDSYLMPC